MRAGRAGSAATARRAARSNGWRASRHSGRSRRPAREPAKFAPLRLVRDEHPSTRWSESQYSVLSGGLVVGRISNDAPLGGDTRPVLALGHQRRARGPAVMQIVGNAATLEEAQQALAENWRRWLAWAALTPDGT